MEERNTLSKAKKKVTYLEVNDVLDLSAQAAQAAQAAQVSAATHSTARTGGRNEHCEVVLTSESKDIKPSGSVENRFLKLFKGDLRKDIRDIGIELGTGRHLVLDRRISGAVAFAVVSGSGDMSFFKVKIPPCKEIELAGVNELVAPTGGFADAVQMTFPSNRVVLKLVRTPSKPVAEASQDSAFGYLLSSETDGQVYEQAFDEDLNLLGNQDVVFDHGFTLTDMIAGNVPVSSTTGKEPNSVLVWTKDTANGECCLDDLRGLGPQQVRAHFFYLEPVD